MERFWSLLENLNLTYTQLGVYFESSTDVEQRKVMEETTRTAAASGAVVGILHLDHQVVTGFDAGGFSLAQPWGVGAVDSAPQRMAYGSWENFNHGPPVLVYALNRKQGELRLPLEILRPSLDLAIDVWEESTDLTENTQYGMGGAAYDNWMTGLSDPIVANQHGAWWNAVVWSECKSMAANYFNAFEHPSLTNGLVSEIAANYQAAADHTMAASDLSVNGEARSAAIEKAKAAESDAVSGIRKLRELL